MCVWQVEVESIIISKHLNKKGKEVQKRKRKVGEGREIKEGGREGRREKDKRKE